MGSLGSNVRTLAGKMPWIGISRFLQKLSIYCKYKARRPGGEELEMEIYTTLVYCICSGPARAAYLLVYGRPYTICTRWPRCLAQASTMYLPICGSLLVILPSVS